MQEVFLNLLPNGVPPVSYISQYDGTSRVIRFRLLNGTEPLTLSGSETITLNFRKPDRETVTLEVENSSSNYIDLVISPELSDKHGEGSGEFRIQGLGTLSFKMYIESDAYGDSLKTRSISGPIATFETDLAEDLIKLDVDLEPIQDLHGYDNPWCAGGGKNILLKPFVHYSLAPNNLDDMFFIKAGDYRFSFSDSTAENWRVGLRMKDAEGNDLTDNAHKPNIGMSWRSTINCWLGGSDSTVKSLSITIAEDCYIRVVFGLASTTADTEFTNVQLEKGTTQTSYEPVENICPITGHTEAKIVRAGKNLINDAIKYAYSGNIVYIGQTDNNYRIFLKAGTYTASVDFNGVPYGFYFKSANSANEKIWGSGSGITSATFVIPEDGYYRFWVYYNPATGMIDVNNLRSIQIELGSAATDYEPYAGTEVTVQFGQTVYKGTLDTKNSKVIATHGIVDLGTLNLAYFARNTRFAVTLNNGKFTNSAYGLNTALCEIYPVVMASYGTMPDKSISVGSNFFSGSSCALVIHDESYTTANELKTALSGQHVVYELAEPIEIDLTQIQTADIEAAPVASFETTLAMPLNTSEHSFSCSQAEGTPTPDSPIPITGVSEIKVFRTGKNLLDKNSYGFVNNGNIIWGGAVGGYADGSFILPSGTYTLSSPVSCAGLYISDNERSIKIVYNKTSITFTLDKTTPIRMMLYINGVTRDDILNYNYQLELGSTATPYEPYSGESVTVSLGGTYYGGKLDISSGVLKLDVGHMIFDGTQEIGLANWRPLTNSVGWLYKPNITPNIKNYEIKATNLPNCKLKSNKLSTVVYAGSEGLYGNDTPCISLVGTVYWGIGMRVNDPSLTSATAINNWLSQNPIEVVYELETPIEISLTSHQIETLVGENNVYCNTGDTALTYYYNMVADPIRIPALVGTNNVYSDAGDVDVEYYTTLEGGND